MEANVVIAAGTVGSYILGSIPSGYLIAKGLKGVDIRKIGSGNPGATNVFRSIGKGPGIATLALDVLKGWGPVFLAQKSLGGDMGPVLWGLAAVVGHTWSVFLKFNGGKGVATSAGVFLALLPVPTAAALGAFVVTLTLSKHVSLGSLAGAVTLAPVAFWLHGAGPRTYLAAALGVLVIVRHIPNIQRLIKGEEISYQGKGNKEEDNR